MEDFFDDFDGDSMDDDYEDHYGEDHEESDIEESVNDDPVQDGDANEEEPEGDGFNPFFVGGMMGFSYEEGRLREEKRKRKNADSDDSSVID